MEADEDGIRAKNTYGGPLLLRTVYGEDDAEETYQYLYNAHGDVVTLLSDGEIAATYCYDSFGNIESQTGEVDNSVLYAGYQYDEETGLYYINARMYDPVTAQFLQRDTCAGTMYDPLSLNLYTYCLNNPHKYVDPSGHFVITAALILMAVRIGISVVSGVMSAKAEYDRQVAEGDNYTNWGSVIFVGVANAGISFFTFGLGQGAAVAAGAGAKAVLKHVGKAVLRDVALGAVADAGVETARQLVTGTKITNLEYDRITEAGVYGGIAGGVSSLAGAGLEGLMRTRVAQKALVKLNVGANKGVNAIKNGFAKIANKNGKAVGLEAVTGVKEPRFKLNLQFFAGDEVYQSGNFSNKVYFGQQAVSPNFSPQGTFKGASIQSVADSLTTGKLSADSLPIEYIVRDGKMITMNNRSLTALSKANMKPTILIDITGNAVNEAKLTQRLSEMGGQPSEKILIRKVGEIVHIPY